MVQFYFNSTYPSIQGDVKSMFSDVVKRYMQLYQQRTSIIDDHVLTCKAPSLIEIGGLNLAKVIVTTEDRNVRYFAISAFGKYPIDDHINPDIWDEDGSEWDYTLNGLDAEDLYFAHRMDWFVLSMPITDSYACDTLTITHRSDSTKILDLPNFYGDNESFILQQIDQIEQYTKVPRATLVEDILAGHECRMTDEFIERYESFQSFAQKAINELFRIARDRGMLFPSIKIDMVRIKPCVGKGLDDLYELRNKMGIRVYFRIDDSVVYLGGIATKADGEGAEQTADMLRAQFDISQLKARLIEEQ